MQGGDLDLFTRVTRDKQEKKSVTLVEKRKILAIRWNNINYLPFFHTTEILSIFVAPNRIDLLTDILKKTFSLSWLKFAKFVKKDNHMNIHA